MRLDVEITADDAVAIITGPKPGTGFLVAPDRLMTNNHVLPDPETTRQSSARLGYRRAPDGSVTEGTPIALDPDAYFVTNAALDYTVVGLAESATVEPLDIRTGARLAVGDTVYVVGHPKGRAQEVVRHDTTVTRVDVPFVGYRADTEGRSSGSPVFDTRWRLVALHHQSAPPGRDEQGNEGVLMTAIAEALV